MRPGHTWIFRRSAQQWMVMKALAIYVVSSLCLIFFCAAVVKLYEHKLKELNPQVKQITYDIADLNNYLDTLQDICALV